MKEILIKLKYFILLSVILLFLFFPTNMTYAVVGLPSAPGLGDACTPSPSTNGGCPTQLFCSETSNKCVECDSDDQCGGGSDTCSSGVCVAPGGNSEGGSCISDSQCQSGLKCGNDKTCTNLDNPPPPPPPKGDDLTEPPNVDLTIQGVFNIITGLACWLLRVIGFVLVIFIILAGLRFMAAQSNSNKFTSAVTNFRNVLIGTLVILGVYVIIATIANAVGLTNFSFIPLVC